MVWFANHALGHAQFLPISAAAALLPWLPLRSQVMQLRTDATQLRYARSVHTHAHTHTQTQLQAGVRAESCWAAYQCE